MTILEVVLRLGAAVIAGGAIGLNRDLRNKPAGVRTHALVALGAALLTILLADDGDTTAVSRVIQGIITGIGFLGAGVILRREGGRTVRGLTTAASVWLVAALGIACGLGRWVMVVVGMVLTLAVLLFGGPLEDTMHRWRRRTGSPAEPGRDAPPGGTTGST